ncbi:two-component sensor histidine kinase [Geotalea uraniireducens]|uniref:histidine kinase n=2 Tax=Geotalea uraniireducens TaxID=351604 RepID=A0ABM8EKG0_9BACT|nr:two-component sensor histidine kinase [Geotalea uraniireducens]
MISNPDDIRPSPEAMLKLAQAEESATSRGKLKIFLGYAAGVGKTYAMLEAARQRKLDGRDVVVAYVESHGRQETDALLDGLEQLPKAMISYMGVQLPELDIDATLERAPQIALVDELAHTNVSGSRHEKRWQDVEELLDAGIDVYTTVNVQHFESLNDIVTQVTGIKVKETVPDRLLDEAFDIKLVDIPPDELMQRLREGKIYIPEQATKAMEKFFRPGNLMALRELSMRRAAARVDEEVRAYMEASAIEGPWPVAERLLVCVSGSPYSEKLIRTTRRLSDEMKAPWHTVYIETPGGGKYLQENRQRVWRDLRLAETLGAQTATMTATSVADALIEYANKHHVTKIVVGKPSKPRWRELLATPLVDRIIRLSGEIDVYVVSLGAPEPTSTQRALPATKKYIQWSDLLRSFALVAAATAVSELLYQFFSPTNLVMIYLLAVVLAATRLGQRPAMMTAFFGVLAFDFFFVPPRFSFAVSDSEYLLSFAALFVVGIVIGKLVSQSRERAEVIREREMQTASLYYLSRDLSAASDVQSVLNAMIKNIESSLEANLAILLPEGERMEIKASTTSINLDLKELAVADWAYRNRQPAGKGTDTLISAEYLYVPMSTGENVLGVLGIGFADQAAYTSPDIRKLLNAFVTQAALAVERVMLVAQAEQTKIHQARSNLERALLNSISHDLRTPLVTISMALDNMWESGSKLTEAARTKLISAARGEAQRLNRFVGNLLDMTRLEAGAVKLKKIPCEVQELIGCSLAALEQRIGDRVITVDAPSDLPLVMMDLSLMIQMMVNLIENAHKYSPVDKPIEIKARCAMEFLCLQVSDYGQGVPQSELNKIFDKFYRIPVPEGAGGTGLGLAICKGIVEAHDGEIVATMHEGGGLRISVILPVGKESSFNEEY